MAGEVTQATKLVNLITTVIEKFLPKYKNDGNLNYCQEGFIKEVLANNRAKVSINGDIYEIPVVENLDLKVNDVVTILLYNFDKNKRIVISKRPSKW